MATARLLTSPLLFCGVALANLLIVSVVARIRQDDRLARAMVWPTVTSSVAVVARATMRTTTDASLAMMMGRASYAAALLMVPALLCSVGPRRRRVPTLVGTTALATAAFIDPALFDGTTSALKDLHGAVVFAPRVTPWSWWLVPYAIGSFVLVARGASRHRGREASWVSTVVLCAIVMGVISVAVVAADLAITPQWGIEIVAAAVATTLLAHHLLARSATRVEQLIEATARVEEQRRASSDHSRRISRLSALGDAAGQLAARLEGPASRLEEAMSAARGEITQACDVGQCDVETMHAIIDAGAAAQRLLRTIRRVRAFAFPEAHSTQRCDVVAHVRRAIAMVDHMARHQTFIRLSAREGLHVIADPDQLTNLFVVLLQAMLRLANQGASSSPLSVRAATDGRRVTVQIASAVRAGQREPIFDPYGDPQAVDDGRGLDMATVHRLVDALGGELRAESASLTVDLPHADAGGARK